MAWALSRFWWADHEWLQRLDICRVTRAESTFDVFHGQNQHLACFPGRINMWRKSQAESTFGGFPRLNWDLGLGTLGAFPLVLVPRRYLLQRPHTHTLPHQHTHTHTRTHTYTHTQTRAHTHTDTHTHKPRGGGGVCVCVCVCVMCVCVCACVTERERECESDVPARRGGGVGGGVARGGKASRGAQAPSLRACFGVWCLMRLDS